MSMPVHPKRRTLLVTVPSFLSPGLESIQQVASGFEITLPESTRLQKRDVSFYHLIVSPDCLDCLPALPFTHNFYLDTQGPVILYRNNQESAVPPLLCSAFELQKALQQVTEAYLSRQHSYSVRPRTASKKRLSSMHPLIDRSASAKVAAQYVRHRKKG